jgi:predicted transcriptional regulator
VAFVREFGELESAIMRVMWDARQPLNGRAVREALRYDRPVAYTTVMTVMDILYRKRVLLRAKHGRAWRYWPAESREDHDARLMTEALRAGGDEAITMRRLVEGFSEDELEHLQTAIREVTAQRFAGCVR